MNTGDTWSTRCAVFGSRLQSLCSCRAHLALSTTRRAVRNENIWLWIFKRLVHSYHGCKNQSRYSTFAHLKHGWLQSAAAATWWSDDVNILQSKVGCRSLNIYCHVCFLELKSNGGYRDICLLTKKNEIEGHTATTKKILSMQIVLQTIKKVKKINNDNNYFILSNQSSPCLNKIQMLWKELKL